MINLAGNLPERVYHEEGNEGGPYQTDGKIYY